MMQSRIKTQLKCPHCGYLDSGNYCSHCGKSLNEESHGWLRESAHELMPLSVLKTLRALIADYKKFFSEVIANNWSNKTRPVPFFISCLIFSMLLSSIFGSPIATITWYDVTNERDAPIFYDVFVLSDEDIKGFFLPEEAYAGASATSHKIRSIVGSIEADEVISYIYQKGMEEDNQQYLLLASSLGTKLIEINSENEVYNLFQSFMMPVSFLIGIWLAACTRVSITSSINRYSSFDVLCYIFSATWMFYTLIEILIWYATQNEFIISVVLFLIIIPSLFFTWKSLKYTNGYGFWKGQFVVAVASFVGVIIYSSVSWVLFNLIPHVLLVYDLYPAG